VVDCLHYANMEREGLRELVTCMTLGRQKARVADQIIHTKSFGLLQASQ